MRRGCESNVYVTHDQVEAMTLGDRLIVMNDGYAAQIGTPLEVYERPATVFVAGFIGSPAMNFLEVDIGADAGSVELPGGLRLPLQQKLTAEAAGKPVILGIRSEHFEIAPATGHPIRFKVDHVEVLGADTLVHGHFVENHVGLTLRLPDIHHFEKNAELPLGVPTAKLHLFDKDTEERLPPV